MVLGETLCNDWCPSTLPVDFGVSVTLNGEPAGDGTAAAVMDTPLNR